MITRKKRLGLIQLQIISECYVYFLQFSKIIKFQRLVLTKIQNLVQIVYIVIYGSCDILKYHYEIFICEIYKYEIYIFMHTFYALY